MIEIMVCLLSVNFFGFFLNNFRIFLVLKNKSIINETSDLSMYGCVNVYGWIFIVSKWL